MLQLADVKTVIRWWAEGMEPGVLIAQPVTPPSRMLRIHQLALLPYLREFKTIKT